MAKSLVLKNEDRYASTLQLKRNQITTADNQREEAPLELGPQHQIRTKDQIGLRGAIDPEGARKRLKTLAKDLAQDIKKSLIEPLQNEPLIGFSQSIAGRIEIPGATKIAIDRIVGSGTLLEIKMSPKDGRIYRTIDRNTGAKIHEWTEPVFLKLVKGVREDVLEDVEAEKVFS
ncbi:MAG: hypothetical protein AAF720_09130 [Pseudomonadota bacterium]